MIASLLALFSFAYFTFIGLLLSIFAGAIAIVGELLFYLFGGIIIFVFEDVILWILDTAAAVSDVLERIMTHQLWCFIVIVWLIPLSFAF